MMTRDFVATGFVVKGKKTLLLKHKKLQMWLPPGGHIEPHELPDDALIREVKEETGLDVVIVPDPLPNMSDVRMLAPVHHIQLEKIKPGHEHIDLIYLCRVVGGELLDEHENDELRWFDYDELDDPEIRDEVRAVAKEAIKKIGG